jgi:hypothetical protein
MKTAATAQTAANHASALSGSGTMAGCINNSTHDCQRPRQTRHRDQVTTALCATSLHPRDRWCECGAPTRNDCRGTSACAWAHPRRVRSRDLPAGRTLAQPARERVAVGEVLIQVTDCPDRNRPRFRYDLSRCHRDDRECEMRVSAGIRARSTWAA